jgi:hypothetical protein
MNRGVLPVLLLVIALLPTDAEAVAWVSSLPGRDAMRIPASNEDARLLTFMQVADGMAGCGYAVLGRPRQQGDSYDELLVWDPETPNVPNGDGRHLLVWIYPDAETARDALTARAQELEPGRGTSTTSATLDPDHGPQLVIGTGGSVWRHNVVLLQQTTMLPSAEHLGREPRPRFRDAGPDAPYAVDADFVACLEQLIQPTNSP